MNRCAKCHRVLKNPSVDGYGPKCRKSAKPIAAQECDLFGYDIEKGV